MKVNGTPWGHMLNNWLVSNAVLDERKQTPCKLKRERRELGMLTKEEYSQEERTLYMYGDSDIERH